MTSPPPPGAMMIDLRALHAQGKTRAAADLLERILEAHPDFMAAHRWRLDVLLEQGKLKETLALAREIRFRFPEMRSMATVKQATALDRLGQVGAARRILLELYETGARDIPALALLGMLLLRDGSLNRAEQMFGEILSEVPEHPEALRGLIDIALKRHRPQEALDLCDGAVRLEALPHDVLQTRRAQCLEQLGRTSEAIAALTVLVDDGVATEQNQITLAWLHRKVGNLEAATAGFGAVLAKTPDRIPAVQGQVAVLRQQGALDAALAVCDSAIAHATPAPDLFHVLRAQVLVAADRAPQAVEALEQVLIYRNGSGTMYLELGRAYARAQALDKALVAFEASRAYEDTRKPALLEQAQVAQQQGGHAQAVTLLRRAAAASDAPEPFVILALCDALVHVGDTADIASLLRGLLDHGPPLTDAEIEQMLILTERQTLVDISCDLIAGVGARPTLSLRLAQRLLGLAHITAEPDALWQIVDTLCAKVPVVERDMFRVDATAVIDGPDAAIRLARGTLGAGRLLGKARLIGRYLVDAGKARLAMRYLRRALFRWPDDGSLVSLYIHACGVAQHHDAGHAYLDQMVARAPDMDVERHRLVLMYNQGATQAAFESAVARHDADLPGLHPRQFLFLCLACGDLDRALSARHRMRNDPTSTSRMAAHFTTGLHGRMLTDLQIYRAIEARQKEQGQTPETIEAERADQFYFPAKQVIDRWAAQTAGDGIAQRDIPVPKRIFQYWDNEKVPDDVAALIAGWKDVPGFEHVLLNHRSATSMLRRQFGRRFVTAFQCARGVTEQSDLLRLCLIYKFGGIYSDADDKVVGDIAGLAELGTGLVVTREPIGAIANNTLIAPAGNPILRIAIDMTVRAMEGRDADGAWLKSGPGMLTRAAAVYLRDADPAAARSSLTLLDGKTLRRFIEPHIRLPYKMTAKYWNAQDKDISHKVLASLTGLASGAAAVSGSNPA